jgi:hypothetical protein
MSEEAASHSNVSTLPCSAIVYRAIRASWVDKDSRLLTSAFVLRPKKSGRDLDGLSVVTSSVDGCASALANCYGVVSLHVGSLRNLGLDIVPDDDTHAYITGLPFPDEDKLKAERLAGLLVKQSRFRWLRQRSTSEKR